MQKRTLKVALLAVLSVVLVLGMSTVALADQTWTDLPDSVTAKYGVTDNQVAAISDGYAGGLWKPYQNITRAQFTKMAVAAFNIPLADPATASFTDVPKGDYYYPYIEGAKAAGVVNGNTATTFNPKADITRQQALAIIARYVADAAGYDLATMYTDDEIGILLAHFGDAASISAELKAEMAFAFDMGITKGNDYGNLAPLANLTRIQGAVMLIRAQALVPPENWTAAEIELISADKTENLIGKTHQVTFEVTTAAGHPAAGVLVDFDTMYANPLYVGNISPQAAVTNNYGQVTVSLFSAEPGTQRVTATVAGVGTIYTTKYWVAMDEAYILGDLEAWANVGETGATELCARVVVIGPGPRSTSQFDWYNSISTLPFDEDDLDVNDGVWRGINSAADEPGATDTWVPRTLAGIGVQWDIVNYMDDNPLTTLTDETVPSVGNITVVDGAEITPAKSALGMTDAEGLSCITIYSEETGNTRVQATATYPENPYPQMLFHRGTADPATWEADDDWEEQPNDSFVMTWRPHDPSGAAGPISPASSTLNIGEELTLVITLEDDFGNPVAGRQVEWFMQGVGWIETDDEATIIGGIDYDVTNAAGQATLFVKSYDAGEQIIHAKVRSKGVGGLEGTFTTYTAEIQWYDVDVASFDDPATTGEQVGVPKDLGGDGYWDDQNEAVAANKVGTDHTFCMNVFGLKLEYAPTAGLAPDQTAWIDSDYPGRAYDGVIDWRDAAYFGGILLVNDNDLPQSAVIENGVVVENDDPYTVEVAGVELELSLVGGITEFDWDGDGDKETFTGQTGIYMPLEGKTVDFATDPTMVGSIVGDDAAVTDADGKACVTITSDAKGPQVISGTVDWPGNPHRGDQLLTGWATKTWQAGVVSAAGDEVIEVWIDGVEVFNSVDGRITDAQTTIIRSEDPEGGFELNRAHVEVHVYDEYGNELPDYEVVYLLNGVPGWLMGTEQSNDTYIPFAYLTDYDEEDIYDQNGSRPDADEPVFGSDPYAIIVGPGGTDAFFFNQWNGSDAETYEGQAGLPSWINDTWAGGPFDSFHQYAPDTLAWFGWPHWIPEWIEDGGDADFLYDGFDGYVYEGTEGDPYYAYDGIGLATDGAKAWTLDGYITVSAGVIENELTGSNIDIQLSEDPTRFGTVGEAPDWLDFWSILGIKVYAPADGLVIDTEPVFNEQVHVQWTTEAAEPDEIVLEGKAPVDAVYSAGPLTIADYDIDLRGMVKDQFGRVLYAGGVLPAGYKLMASAEVLGLNHVDLTDLEGYEVDDLGWVDETMYDIPSTTVTFQAWLDADDDNVIDATEVQSNELVVTFQNDYMPF